jgi:phosphatidylglycerophosphatase A
VKRPLVALSLATAFGVGYVPFAPGTFGSAVGLVIWALLPASSLVHAAAILIIFAVGTWSATAAERYFGGTDPGPVVIDEVMGMLLTLFMHPVGWTGAIGAFLLFRAFDVLKPYPADRLEQVPGGLGVMADDGMAAIYANLVLWGVLSAIGWLS